MDGWIGGWLDGWSFAESNLKTREQTDWTNVTDLNLERGYTLFSFRIREIRACVVVAAFRTSGRVSNRDEFVTNLQKRDTWKTGQSRSHRPYIRFTAGRRYKTGASSRFIDSISTLSNSILSLSKSTLSTFSRLKNISMKYYREKKCYFLKLIRRYETNN